MGLSDKFKNLADQAKASVVEHKDQLHEAIDGLSVAANEKTGGKHANRIMKFNEKATDALHKLTSTDSEADAPAAESEAEGAQDGATRAEEAGTPAASYTPPSTPPPAFDE